jgi:glutaminyl-peptide cyclotransferase
VMSLFGAVFAVTGKLWPKLYEIKLRPVDGPADGSVEKLCPKASFYR